VSVLVAFARVVSVTSTAVGEIWTQWKRIQSRGCCPFATFPTFAFALTLTFVVDIGFVGRCDVWLRCGCRLRSWRENVVDFPSITMKQSDAVFVCEFLVFAFLEWFVISSIECERVETESNAKEIVRNFGDVETDGSERVIDALQSSVPVGEAQFV
jgi:hypothetical protein